MLQNVIAGCRASSTTSWSGHYVGYVGNAAIGVSWQIVLVVIVFISSGSRGWRCCRAGSPRRRFAQGQSRRLPVVPDGRGLSVALGVVGYVAAPWLLTLINAAPEVRSEALPFLRTMFVGIVGLIMFFMLSGAFRAAGDPADAASSRPGDTVLTIALNVTLIPCSGRSARVRTFTSSTLGEHLRRVAPDAATRHPLRARMDRKPEWGVNARSSVRLPPGAGIRNVMCIL